jgi:hypothetical protein
MEKEEKVITPEAVVSQETEVTPTPEVAPAPVNRYADRLSKAYPDRKFESPEDYDTGMDEYLGSLEEYKTRGQDANKKLLALFDAEPQVGEIVRDMISGATFREALARHISPEDIVAIEGDPDYEGWSKNKAAREESIGKRRKFEDEYANNLNVSQAEMEAWAEENGLEETKVQELLEKIDGMLSDFNNGRITKEALSRLNKAFTYDTDLAKAKEDGEIAGRNQAIVAKKEVAPTEGDGLPRPTKAGDSPDKPATAPNYMDELAARVKKRQVM